MTMLILPMLLLAAAQDSDRLPESVPATESTIFFGPSRSLKADVATEHPGLPATPVTHRFQCLVDSWKGEPVSCIPLDGAAKPAATRTEFAKRAGAWNGGQGASATLQAAYSHVMFTRLRSTGEAPADATKPNLVPMILSGTVSASDSPKLPASLGTIASSDMEMDDRPSAALLTAYYPAQALRENVEIRMRADCRVQPDRMLLCRDARAAEGEAELSPALLHQFAMSTYQVIGAIRLAPLTKKGDPVVGREVEVRIAFVVPGE
ncbi:hypothetical protein TPR58_01745 [Sphingomonas sp. HF-S3]|uniref:TonB C-terminal domain-containing protein n=1 Tax=Sphingomonas rustica TaxID=3103142 RepID=A0ABV0B475_9SPHN